VSKFSLNLNLEVNPIPREEQQRLSTIVSNHGMWFRPEFISYLNACDWVVYSAFRELTLLDVRHLKESGQPLRSSARMLSHILRFFTRVSDADTEFQINNNWIPDMARLFSLEYPEHSRLFKLRTTPLRGNFGAIE
jgi:hypothetical protein